MPPTAPHIVLYIDDTFDAVHGGQQPRLFKVHHDEYGSSQIVVFDGDGRMNAAVLRPASKPYGKQDRALAPPADHRNTRPVATYRTLWYGSQSTVCGNATRIAIAIPS